MSAKPETWKASGIKIRAVINKTKLADGTRQSFGESYVVTVPAKLTGTGRIRRQFDTRKVAEDFAAEQFAGTKSLGEQFFEVSATERREAVAALDLVRPRQLSIRQVVSDALMAIDSLPEGVSLIEAARFAGPRLRPVGGDRTVDQVVEEMITSKKIRFRSGQLRDRSLVDFRTRARRFSATEGQKLIKAVSHSDIKKWVVSLGVGVRSNKNYLNTLSEVFRFARQRKYILLSPLDDFTDDDLKEMRGNGNESGEPNILTIEQSRKLLQTALAHPELDLLAAVTLGLFCGIRTAELTKLDWSHLSIDKQKPKASFVTIPAGIAKKRRIRHVSIPANALSWLALCPRQTGPLAPNHYSSDYRKRFLKLQRLAGFGRQDEDGSWHSTWEENNMRHSFGSYHFALHGNSIETARQLGHRATDHVLFDHYRALAKKEDGKSFFNIMPPNTKAG